MRDVLHPLKIVFIVWVLNIFNYDLSSSQAKIIYKRDELTQEDILKCIKDLGYEPYVSDVIEDEEYA